MKRGALELALAEARLRRELPSPAFRRLIRERAGVSQRRLALALGVSHSTLGKWETGAMTPRGNNLARYFCALAYIGRAAGLGTASPAAAERS
jgi:transcriptional regulator with XRE-family HTH domain